jgi:hypothetical protein
VPAIVGLAAEAQSRSLLLSIDRSVDPAGARVDDRIAVVFVTQIRFFQ